MVRPMKPKEIKPKAEAGQTEAAKPTGSGGAGLDGIKIIIVNTVTTLIICVLFLGGVYFVVDKVVSSKISQIGSAGGDNADNQDKASQGDEEVQRGLILDLGEFILNLSDPKVKRYLKVDVALELTRTPGDPDPAAVGDSGGEHGKGADPLKIIEAEMSQYKPAIRDAVISIFPAKTAEELSSVAGKELAKEQIKEAVNAIFAGEREVLRVSFGNFIIQ